MKSPEPFIHRLVDLQRPGGVRLSPSARYVVYHTTPGGRKGEHTKSTLWIADVGIEHSARQLTSGLFNDHSPRWTPDGSSVIFISDRAKSGKSCALYCVNIFDIGGEAYPLTPTENEKTIERFEIEPSAGKFIAYASSDEVTPDKKRRDEAKDDAQVHDEDWEYNRLRLLHIPTKTIQTLFGEARHVTRFTWSDSSSKIIFLSQDVPGPNEDRMRFSSVLVSTRGVSAVCDFPGMVYSELVSFGGESVFFLASKTTNSICSSSKVYTLNCSSGEWKLNYSIPIGGVDDGCAEQMTASRNALAVKYAEGCMTQMITMSSQGRFSKIQVSSDIGAFESILMEQEGSTSAIVAYVESTPARPCEVKTVAVKLSSTPLEHTTESRSVLLSTHGSTISEKPYGTCFAFKTELGTATERPQGLMFLPQGTSAEGLDKAACVVLIHGGPYWRATMSFDPTQGYTGYCYPALANQGYAILSPNYSGSSGRGEEWAARARGGMGTVEYEDVLALIDTAIGKGWIDKNRIVVGGWSQGGFLSYLCATRNGCRQDLQVNGEQATGTGNDRSWTFKGAICGAGVTDWDMLTMTSDVPVFEAELAGGAPWAMEKSDVSSRQGSAIWEMSKARKEDIPPILILHGKEDKRVPWTQALAYSRACKAKGVPCQFVTYPREEHLFVERGHLIDLCERVVKFVESCIGQI